MSRDVESVWIGIARPVDVQVSTMEFLTAGRPRRHLFAMPRAPTRAHHVRERSKRCTKRFWSLLFERVRQLLEELHGDSESPGGGWSRRSSTNDVTRATILARREVLADSDTRRPHNFLRGEFAHVSEETLRRVRSFLATYGFNARVAGQVASSDVAFRLSTMPTLDWSRERDHGRRVWTKQLQRLFGKLYILDIGCGRKSWSRWPRECVASKKAARRFEVVTIDWDVSMEPDIRADITKWRAWLHVELEKRGHGGVRFHIVHFAAECTEYSPLKNGRERDLAYATWLAQCGMLMILELRPLVWFIECAGSGAHALQHQPIMNDAHMKRCHVDLTLCHCGADYRKHSSWWTNIPKNVYAHYGFPERPCCAANGRKCLWALLFDRHPRHVGGGHGGGDSTPSVAREECMTYPPLLCAQWMASALHAMLTYEEA